MKKLLSATLVGVEATPIEVESTFTKGMPNFAIVGLANNAIMESKDRIKSALLTNNFKFPPLRITLNLSPSDLKKDGSHFDLAIALSIILQNENVDFDDFFIFGELGLNGKLKDTKSIFPIVLSLAEKNLIKKIIVPKDSVEKLSMIPNIEIYGIDKLNDVISFFRKELELETIQNKNLNTNFLELNNNKYFYIDKFDLDFSDVKGQIIAKRGALISSAGFHNILFEGSPGCGKSMIAKRLQYILPPLSLNEILDIAKIESLNSEDPTFRPIRTFRNPHHSSTKSSIFGGGSREAKLGEVAIANNGILFFDELPHFGKQILEALREPLEDNRLLISRVNQKVEYKTKFLFIGAQNPCPCGNLLSKTKDCRCSDIEIQRYKNRLSEPFLDRIDIYIQMSEVNLNDKSDISSEDIFKLVKLAFSKQILRGQKNLNGKMDEKEIEKFCKLNEENQIILDNAINRFSLSFRSINKILKVARTIADLDDSENIEKKHLLESLGFRRR